MNVKASLNSHGLSINVPEELQNVCVWQGTNPLQNCRKPSSSCTSCHGGKCNGEGFSRYPSCVDNEGGKRSCSYFFSASILKTARCCNRHRNKSNINHRINKRMWKSYPGNIRRHNHCWRVFNHIGDMSFAHCFLLLETEETSRYASTAPFSIY